MPARRARYRTDWPDRAGHRVCLGMAPGESRVSAPEAPFPRPPLPATQRPRLLHQWMLRVVLPLLLAVAGAFALLAHAATLAPANTDTPLALWQGGLLLVAALLLVASAGWGIARRVLDPIAALTVAVEHLGKGEPVQLEVTQAGVLGRLQLGVNEASRTLEAAHNRMQSELGRTTVELADKNARLEAASQSRARFLAAASHDLRQPLYALTLFSSALRAGETDPDKLARVMHIEECVASLDQLFAELLDLSRLEAGAMQATPTDVRLDDVFDEVSRNFRMLAESRGLRLIVRKTDAWVRCDRTMLARMLNNLVSNALRYSDDGGVLVGVRQLDSGQVRIDVWDTGSGIEPEHQQRVFDEFYQVKRSHDHAGERKRGLGLGLATVRRLAELVGCEVDLASRVGRGTCVRLTLDAANTPAPVPAYEADIPIDISGLRVIVIDDDITILQGLRALLEEWGCELLAADDEASAVREARHWPAPPDLVISDLRLREGRSGLDVLRALARHYGNDPATPGFARLLVTGETRPDRLAEIAANKVPVLFKPVSPDRLREAMLAAVFAARAQAG